MGLAKAIIIALLNSVAFVLFMIACGTAWAEVENNTHTSEYGYWKICTTPNSGGDSTCKDASKANINCDKRFEVIEAGRAFTLMTAIFVGVLTLVSFYRIFNNDILLKAGIVGKVYLGVGILSLLFAIFSWIIGFAQYSEEYCGVELDKNTTQNKIGPSAPAGFVASCVFLVSLLAECIFADVDGESTAEEDKKDESEDKKNESEEKKDESESKAEPAAEPAAQEEEKKEPTPKADE